MQNKPICYEKNKIFPEIYGGTPTFMGLPKISLPEDLNNFDVVFNGIPWEGLCTWGPFAGCELSPKTIRAASVRYGGFLPEYNVDVFDTLTAGDYGDINCLNNSVEKTHQNIYERAKQLFDKNIFPVTFGGDHSITYPIMKALAEKHHGKIGIVHIDAHFDNYDSFDGSDASRCSPLFRAYHLDGINPENIVHIGIRGPRNHPREMANAVKYGTKIITSFELRQRGLDTVIKEAIEKAHEGTEAVYMTMCSDSLDISSNPGGPPDPCGLNTYEAARILHDVAASGIAGFDIVEIYPPIDHNNVSSHTACWMMLYVLAGLAQYRKNK